MTGIIDAAAEDAEGGFDEWAILEVLGHRRLAGRVTEAQIAGASFLRIDIPTTPPMTQLYSPSSVYAITPVDERIARHVANRHAPTPVHVWELPKAEPEPYDEAAAQAYGEDADPAAEVF